MTGRRGLLAAVGLAVAGAALCLLAAGRPWATALVVQPEPLPSVRVGPSGRDLAGLSAALALVGLAAALALVATRGWGRRLTGVLLLVAGVLVVVDSLAVLADLRSRFAGTDAFQRVAAAGSTFEPDANGWPLANAGGGLVLTVAGLAAAASGHRMPAMSGRYDAPSRRSSDPVRDSWDALDRGQDPTAGH